MNENWIEVIDGKRPELPSNCHVFVKDATTGWEDYVSAPVAAWAWSGVAHKITHYRLAAPAKADYAAPQMGLPARALGGKGELQDSAPESYTTSAGAAPRWVRCSDRLPADGREYRANVSGLTCDIKTVAGKVHFRLEGFNTFEEMWDSHVENTQWLDEAPAQEGQRTERQTGLNAGPSGAERERVEWKQWFRVHVGWGRRF